jgi:GT2 family glycosyltransferase
MAFAPAGSARVAVVIVTHGAWAWTQRALAALHRHTPDVELVIVDNASRDGTPERVAREVGGARLVANADNVGFARAANQGAESAGGELVAFLNNDALVHEGWLEPLVEALDRDERVAAAAPRLLNLDGSLQEAGALVARDGSTWSYGYGDDPARPEYGFPRVVDYAAGACLLVRRSALAQCGGFSELFSPAYYEDVDLCFALAAHGLRTVYEPRSLVTHARHASGDAAQAHALSRRHRVTFLERWGDALEARPGTLEPPRPRAALGARDAHALDRVLVAGAGASVDPLLRALAALWPDARITALLDDADPAGARATGLLAQGIEAVAEIEDSSVWLGDRRLHYDVVVAGDGAPDELWATQPQALGLSWTDLLDAGGAPRRPSELHAALAPAGVAPPAPDVAADRR